MKNKKNVIVTEKIIAPYSVKTLCHASEYGLLYKLPIFTIGEIGDVVYSYLESEGCLCAMKILGYTPYYMYVQIPNGSRYSIHLINNNRKFFKSVEDYMKYASGDLSKCIQINDTHLSDFMDITDIPIEYEYNELTSVITLLCHRFVESVAEISSEPMVVSRVFMDKDNIYIEVVKKEDSHLSRKDAINKGMSLKVMDFDNPTMVVAVIDND